MFLLSPQDGGGPRVIWRRNRIEVRPRRDFRPNTAYSVSLLPGLTDLRGNALKTGRTIIFSTGPALPTYWVLGRVFDWMNGRVASRALVEVIRHPDSLPYVGFADSTGQFQIGPLDPGEYTVLAIMDNNNNRGLDPGEPWDSVQVSVKGVSAYIEMLAAQRDSIPPRLLTVGSPDTLTLIASFDRPLEPLLRLGPSSFRILAADSTPIRITRVETRAEIAQRAARDSVARRDSIARADTTMRDSLRARADSALARRVAATVAPKPSRLPPSKDISIHLDSLTPMRPGATYRVTALNIQGLLGRAATTERVYTVPVPPRPRPDSTRARPDSTRPPPDSARARPPSSPPASDRPSTGRPP